MLTTSEFIRQYPKAFKDLPPAYVDLCKDDTCLEFWITGTATEEVIWVSPKEEHKNILGVWVAYYDATCRVWIKKQVLK